MYQINNAEFIMLKNILKFLYIIMMLIFMVSCREYYLYGYKPVVMSFAEGEFYIRLDGAYGQNYEKDGKKFADLTYPYILHFSIEVPLNKNLYKLYVKNVILVGEKSRKETKLGDIESKKVHGPSKYYPDMKTRIARASVNNLMQKDINYENQKLTATVIIYEDEQTFREEKIEVTLETDFKKEKRSDTFDEFMSV